MSRLLVIDDSLTIRKAVELSFKPTGMDLEFGSSGGEGIELAVRNRPDIILLDFILPDMRGPEVCQRLTDARLGAVPVIVLSGNQDGVREQFKACPQVVEFMVKPFVREDIIKRVNAALSAQTAPAEPPPPPAGVFSFEQKQAAAKLVFAHLKLQLAQIPQWMTQMGQVSSAASYFAKKMLTPEVMDELLDALFPFYKAALEAAPAPAMGGGATLKGQISGWPALSLLQGIAVAERTGDLTMSFEKESVVVWCKRGVILMVSSQQPQTFAADAGVDLGACAPDARAKAEAEQRASGKPLFVSLAEAGHLPATQLKDVLFKQGRRALQRALSVQTLSFEWKDRTLPTYVEAHGRAIPISQLIIDQLRASPVTGDKGRSAELVYARAERFSEKVRTLDLNANERRLLTLADGKTPAANLLQRAGVSQTEGAAALDRLVQAGLIEARRAGGARPRVLVYDPDADGFRKPLAQLLKSRSRPLELTSLEAQRDIVAAIGKERPMLAIVNASAAGEEAERVGRAVAATGELSDTRLLAVLDVPDESRADELASAGYDAVLYKPIHFQEIELLLGAS